jgi:hypothetical protein
MNYEIWDVETGNCVGSFNDESAALKWVQALLDRFGTDYADSLVVGVENQRGEDAGSWSGEELRARLAAAPKRKATAAD